MHLSNSVHSPVLAATIVDYGQMVSEIKSWTVHQTKTPEMKFKSYLFLLFFFPCYLSCDSPTNTNDIITDICILGGSEAGFTAAIQAARMGKRVVLIEPTGHPGGMVVEGLGQD